MDSLSKFLEAVGTTLGIDRSFLKRHKILFAVLLVLLCVLLIVSTWGVVVVVAGGIGIGSLGWLLLVA